MRIEWVFIAVGSALLYLAVRPLPRLLQRERSPLLSSDASSDAAEPEIEPVAIHRPVQTAPQPQPPSDPLEMPWLDSLLASSPPPLSTGRALDDVSKITAVLRFWLSEDKH
jgi:hypothetical protein